MSDQLVDLGLGPYFHEKLSARFPVYTRGNAGEVYPQVAYPLTISMSRTHEDPFAKAAGATGILTDADIAEGPAAFGACLSGYMYLNLSMQRTLAIRTPGTTIESSDATYLGSEGIAPPYVPHKDDRNLRASLRVIRFGLSLMNTTEIPHLVDDQRALADLKAAMPRLDTATDAELVAYLNTAGDVAMDMFANHLLVSGQAGGAMQLLAQFCEDRFGDRALALTLLGGLGDVDSAAPSWALWDLGRLVAASPALTQHFDEGIEGLQHRLQADPDAAEFNRSFAAFLDVFGARGPNEWEAAVDTWGTQPDMPLALIERMRRADERQSPTVRQAGLADKREAATARCLDQLRWPRSTMFKKILTAATVLSVGRERSKTTVVGAIHQTRLVSRVLGRRIAERLPGSQPDDLWFVVAEELDAYLEDPQQFSEQIAQRRATREALSLRVPPFVVDGVVPPPTSWPLRAAADGEDITVLESGQSITGLGGCPGVAEGRARVVTSATDPGDLGPGDVLVAPLTDPAWTPLFVPAEAVVVDVGGQMSHAVIVSRELGLPCVVAATDATKRIPDGAMIRVDGTAGTVTLL